MASLAVSIAKNEFIVGGKYRLMRKIGSGSFGDIYLGINISNGEVRKRKHSLKGPRRPTLRWLDLPAIRVSRSSSRLVLVSSQAHVPTIIGPFLGRRWSRSRRGDRFFSLREKTAMSRRRDLSETRGSLPCQNPPCSVNFVNAFGNAVRACVS